jgi:hypothetical protein
MSDINKMADDELAKLGLASKKPEPTYGRSVFERSQSRSVFNRFKTSDDAHPWSKTPAPRGGGSSGEPANPFARLQDMGKVAWTADGDGKAYISHQHMDRAVVIFKQQIERKAELLGMACVDDRGLYLEIEAMLTTYFAHWDGTNTHDVVIGNAPKRAPGLFDDMENDLP